MESNTPGQNVTWDFSHATRTPRIIFLSLFMAVTFLGSLFIIIVLVHNIKLRSVQNLIIANMCVTCILDIIFNMTLVMSSLIANEWIYGVFMCKMNTFFMHFVTIKTLLMLTTLSADQYFSQRFDYKYNAWLSTYRVWSIIAYVWLHSIAFSIPCLTDVMKSAYQPHVNLCTVEGETPLTLLCITILACFIGPSALITVTQAFMCRLSCKLKNMKRTEVMEKNYTQMQNESPQRSNHVHPSLYTVILFLLWLILEVPFTLTSYIKQYEYSQHLVPGTVTEFSLEVGAIFLWMRFFFSAVFPFVTFFFKKEIWQSAKECVLCRRHNSIVDMNVACKVTRRLESSHKIEKDASSKSKDSTKDKSETPSSLNFNVPVLFATSTGICIEDASIGYNFGESNLTTNTTDMKGKTLDISYDNYVYADELIDDTSDYDSSCEIDQYSSSQPVSTKNVLESLKRTRSMSDPEISFHHCKSKVTAKDKDLTVTFIGDSGLDLSGTSSSSLGGTETSKSKISLIGRLATGSSSLTEAAADTNTEDHLVRGQDQNCENPLESKVDDVLKPNGFLSSSSLAHDDPFAMAATLVKETVRSEMQGNKQERLETAMRSGSSPQRSRIKVAVERQRVESATIQSSDKLPSNKINNNEGNHYIPPNGRSGRKSKETFK